MTTPPLVSIICTVYNQEGFLAKALESVFQQTYQRIELLIIDNGSIDRSSLIIQEYVKCCPSHISVSVFVNPFPKNYCQSFNEVFKVSKGEYFIDLSGDDCFFPDHVEVSIRKLKENPDAWAVFSNVELHHINSLTKYLYYSNEYQVTVEEGDLYVSIVKGNPVLSVSLVIDSEKFRNEGMYDESLVYEDFDLLVRMSRKYPLYYSRNVGVKKTIHNNSYSFNQYLSRNSKMLPSTFLVCKKIQQMNQAIDENEALKVRVAYELKMAVFSANFEVAKDFIQLGKEIGVSFFILSLYQLICFFKFDLSFLIRVKKKFD